MFAISSAPGFGVVFEFISSSSCEGIGESRPPMLLTVEVFDDVLGRPKLSFRGNGRGESCSYSTSSGTVSKESELELVGETFPGELERFISRFRTVNLGLMGLSLSSLNLSFFLPLFFWSGGFWPVSLRDFERPRLVLLAFASGFITHHELFPLPSFWTRTNLLWRLRLWRIEFWREKKNQTTLTMQQIHTK